MARKRKYRTMENIPWDVYVALTPAMQQTPEKEKSQLLPRFLKDFEQSPFAAFKYGEVMNEETATERLIAYAKVWMLKNYSNAVDGDTQNG